MSPSDQQLLRRLAVAITIKLVLLTALWWLFIRDVRVHVESREMAQRVTQAGDTIPHSGKASVAAPFPSSSTLVGDPHAQ